MLLWQGDGERERQQDVFAQSGHCFWAHAAAALGEGQQDPEQLAAHFHERQLVSGGHGSGKALSQSQVEPGRVHAGLISVCAGAGPPLLPPAGEHSSA